ncbi:hypothetical protein F5Y07DRAFT_412742 [Xylaria sp. FL0933]|nr:hypothetical protein F5Y07DRAFT_412742 [Xylaria sp. FL0933]
MASLSWDDVSDESLRKRLHNTIDNFLYEPQPSTDMDDLWEQFMVYFDWDVNEESNPEIVQQVHEILKPHIWDCLEKKTGKLLDLLIGFRDSRPDTFCDPIAFTLHYFHDKIVREARWDLWCAYSSLVGGFMEDELDMIQHEDLVLRILIQAFEYPHDPTVRAYLVAGAAMCLKELIKPVVIHIATVPEWDLRGLVPGRRSVTSVDWKYWTSCMYAFSADLSNDPIIRELAANAARYMWTE